MPLVRVPLARRALAALLAIAMPLAPATAATDCRTLRTQVDMDICAGQELQKADDALNALYRQMQARLKSGPAQTRRLTETQRAWAAFRDAECRFVSQPGPGAGSIQPMIEAQCLTEQTERRSRDLQRYLHCPEGDMSCPLPPG